jgi:hypothetical protein
LSDHREIPACKGQESLREHLGLRQVS